MYKFHGTIKSKVLELITGKKVTPISDAVIEIRPLKVSESRGGAHEGNCAYNGIASSGVQRQSP